MVNIALMKLFLKITAFVYAVLGIIAILMVPASLYGWFGIEEDPLSGVFALLMGLPWTLALNLFRETGTYFSLIVSAVGISINSLLLYWLGSLGTHR